LVCDSGYINLSARGNLKEETKGVGAMSNLILILLRILSGDKVLESLYPWIKISFVGPQERMGRVETRVQYCYPDQPINARRSAWRPFMRHKDLIGLNILKDRHQHSIHPTI
jgi:hypothetical protein